MGFGERLSPGTAVAPPPEMRRRSGESIQRREDRANHGLTKWRHSLPHGDILDMPNLI